MLGPRVPLRGLDHAKDFARRTGSEYRSIDPPCSYTYGVPEQRLDAPETFVLVIPNGRVLGSTGVVVTSENRLLADVSIAIARPEWRHPALSRLAFPKVKHIEGEAAIVSSVFPTNYWHWMVDVLPRIGLLERAGFRPRRLIVNADLPFQKETLKTLGYGDDSLVRLDRDAHVEVERLIVPSLQAPFCMITPEAIAFLRRRFLGAGEEIEPSRLIYLSRKDAARRRIVNEDELMARLEPLGFESVMLSNLTVAEQARLFASARLVLAPHGAGCTNMVFARPGAGFVEFMPDNGYHPSFELLTSLLGCHYGRVHYTGPLPAPDDPSADIEAILRSVQDMLELCEGGRTSRTSESATSGLSSADALSQETTSEPAQLSRESVFKAFCFEAGVSAGPGPGPVLNQTPASGSSIIRFEPELADAMLRGLFTRFGTQDVRALIAQQDVWRETVADTFMAIENACQRGAARALWAQFARPISAALPVGATCAVGPIFCAAFDAASATPIRAPDGVDSAVVSIRNGAAHVAVVELPVFRDATLGAALRAGPGSATSKLWALHGAARSPLLAARLARAGFREWRSVAGVFRNADKKVRLLGLFRNIHDRALDALRAPIFAANAPAAQDVIARVAAEIPERSSSRSAPPNKTADSHVRRAHPGASTMLVPVLMYHRIAPDGEAGLTRFRTTPDDFAKQLDALKALGYASITSDMLSNAYISGQSLPDRPVLITFDDGYLDFALHAYPALQSCGFTAEVFVVTDLVGERSSWDDRIGATAPLMDWSHIRDLHDGGIRFGSHLATHSPVTHMTSLQLIEQAARSRRKLEVELNSAVKSVAIPYGLYDDRVIPALEWSGYEIGFSTANGIVRPSQNRLRLPRVEVRGGISLDQFRELLPFR